MTKYFSAVLLFVCALGLSGGDLKGKGEVDAFGGGVDFSSGGGNHGLFGVSGAYGLMPWAQVYGEYSYAPLGSGGGVSLHLNDFQGGVKVSMQSDTIEPYGLLGLGMGRFTTSVSGFSSGGLTFSGSSLSTNNFGLHIGGGARFYMGSSKKWGVEPEIRWGRYFASNSGSLNVFRYTGGIFYQWGK
jgi:hypothetical protein